MTTVSLLDIHFRDGRKLTVENVDHCMVDGGRLLGFARTTA